MNILALALTLGLFCAAGASAAEWTPQKWEAEDTLEFLSECPGEAEHWSFVWLVVLDGDVWVRLGSRAGARVDCHKTKPFTSIRIGGQRFDGVELVHVPEMEDRVALAMADKYATDIFVRYLSHPYTMKLVPKKE